MALRIGFIGLGGVAQVHLQNLATMPGVRLTAVCDINRQRAEEASSRYGARHYKNYKTMLRAEDLDAALVCVFPAAHKSIELDLAQAGIPFFIEKPVHLDLDACKKVIRAVDRKNLVTAVGYHFRSLKSTQSAKKFLKGKQIAQVHGAWFGTMPPPPWWRVKRLSGGQLVEQTTHIVDLTRYLAGEIKEVFALGSKGLMKTAPQYNVEDTSILTLKFKSGAVGVIRSGCIGTEKSRHEVGLFVEGNGFTLRVDGDACIIEGDKNERIPSGQFWQEQIANGVDAFIKAVNSKQPGSVFCDYRDGANTLAVTIAGNESMKTGKPVKVRRF